MQPRAVGAAAYQGEEVAGLAEGVLKLSPVAAALGLALGDLVAVGEKHRVSGGAGRRRVEMREERDRSAGENQEEMRGKAEYAGKRVRGERVRRRARARESECASERVCARATAPKGRKARGPVTGSAGRARNGALGLVRLDAHS
eukprot:2186902-Pleurochrysis_carterae.AAC.2